MEISQKVYSNLRKVPKGKVTTYKELAKSINSKAYRYMGYLMKHNKDSINIPCYKVINSDGSIGNYSGNGGIKTKIKLLKKDGIKIKNKKIDLKKYLHKF